VKIIRILFVLAVIIVGAGLGIIFSGTYNVAATEPHNPLAAWVFDTTMDYSVRHQAQGIQVPDLTKPDMVQNGFRHYDEMCVECHGAPGKEPEELAKGLNPPPPDLVESVPEWKPAELFWIVKHGVRMTGMPAWGPTHSDDKLWAVVAFLEKLPKLTAAEYKAMEAGAGDAADHMRDRDRDHDH